MKTQTERVIAAARSYRGITQVDFLLPGVCDGGAPITRVAARLHEADLAGYTFECLGRRDKCKVWRLVSEPDAARNVSTTTPPVDGPLRPADVSLSAEPEAERLFTTAEAKPHWKAA